MDLTALVSMLMGGQEGTTAPSGLLSNLPPPAPLSGLTFAEPGYSGAESSLGGSPGDGGLVPGQGAGPGLDILSLLNQYSGDEGVANTTALTTPIGGTLGGSVGGGSMIPLDPGTGQNTIGGQTSPEGPSRTGGTIAGETSGALPSLSLIASALGLLGKSGLFASSGALPDIGPRGDTGGVSLSDQLRDTGTPTSALNTAYEDTFSDDISRGLVDDLGPVQTPDYVDDLGPAQTPDLSGEGFGLSDSTRSTLSGGLQAAKGLTGLTQGLLSDNVSQSVGGGLQTAGALANLGGYSDVAAGLEGAGSLLSLVEGARSGNPGQIAKGAVGTYNSAASLLPEVLPSIGAAAPVVGMVIAALTEYYNNQDKLDTLTSGRWNNPIKGRLSSAATSGIEQATDRLDAQDLSTTPTDTLLADLPKILDDLLPYYATAQGGRGAIKASDTFTGGSGASKSAPSGDYGAYTQSFTNAQTKLLDLVNTLLDRGVTYEELGAVPARGEWAEQTRDLSNPLDEYFRRGQATYEPEATSLIASMAPTPPTPDPYYEWEGQVPTTWQWEAPTVADLFQASKGAGEIEGAQATSNITDMYGGPLWTALARMGLGGDAMTDLIQEHFDPWANTRTFSVEDLYSMLPPPASNADLSLP